MTTMTPVLNYDSYGRKVKAWPEFGTYANARLAIMLNGDEGPETALTVNMPGDHLNPGEVFIKDWSENKPAVKAALDAGWLRPVGREVASGYVNPKVMVMDGDLLAYYQATFGAEESTKKRRAVIRTDAGATVARYLPSNYSVVGATPEGHTIIEGEDVAGWTLDGYVLPRLASGMYYGEEV